MKPHLIRNQTKPEMINMDKYVTPSEAIKQLKLEKVFSPQQIGWLINMSIVDGFKFKSSGSVVNIDSLQAFLHYYYNRRNEALIMHLEQMNEP